MNTSDLARTAREQNLHLCVFWREQQTKSRAGARFEVKHKLYIPK
jgi:hypothetical protein